MKTKSLEELGFNPDELLLMEGYEDCIVGVVERYGIPPIICYDKQKVIDKLTTESGGNHEDAEEFFEYNQIGAWVGATTPCFITTITL